MSHTASDRYTVLVAHPSPELYGSDRVLLENVSGLLARGWRVFTVLPGPGPLSELLETAGSSVRYLPFPVLRKSILNPRGMTGFIRDSIRGIRSGGQVVRETNPDAVFVNTMTIPLWILISRFNRKPVTIHVHESERNAPALVRILLAAPATLCQRIISNSEYSTESLIRFAPWLRKRTTVIYNGVPGPPSANTPRETINGPARLLFNGRLSERKGAHIAVEALGLLQEAGIDAQLELLGAVFPGYEWFESQLREKISSLPDSTKVNFVGFDSNVWPHYEACDIALVPSTVDEPFGNTAVEAILAQRPVVVSKIGGLPEAVRSIKSAVLVTPNDPTSLANGIKEIISEWPKFKDYTEAAATEAARRYDPPTFGRQIASIVEDLILKRSSKTNKRLVDERP